MHNPLELAWFLIVFIIPFAGLFAMGYFPALSLPMLIVRRNWITRVDVYVPLAGAIGSSVAFLLIGLCGIDRFALVSDHVKSVWYTSGYTYELIQPFFSGVVSGSIFALLSALNNRVSQMQQLAKPVVASAVSFVALWLWPTVVSVCYLHN
jgi:hypothetical protein